MKPVAYKNACEAVLVALCGGGCAVTVSGSLCEDEKEGLLVVTDDHRLWDEQGRDFHAVHECLRLPKGERPGKWELRLEPVEDE
jgi:hypothetical protein